MQIMATENQQYQIGKFLFLRDEGTLTGPEAAYRLSAPIAQLLQLLADNPGEPVARDQIIGRLWAGRVAAGRALTRGISLLRKYLGDSAQKPQYIETIPGYGYRLIARVTKGTGGGESEIVISTRTSRAWRFLIELRQRKVCRATVLYALSVWLVFQIADVAFTALRVPDWVLSFVVVIGVLGFPIAVILAWVFEVTPAGLVLDVPYSDNRSREYTKRDACWNLVLLAVSLVISCQMLVSGIGGFDVPTDRFQRLAKAQSIVVAPFRATSVNLETKAIAFALSEQLRHLLYTELGLEVFAAEALPMLGNAQIRADLLMEGSVETSADVTQVIIHLVDPSDGHYLWSEIITVTGRSRGIQPDLVREILNVLPVGQQQIEEKSESILADTGARQAAIDRSLK
jgi:DNA-binding winged helix-turn-helix (wHTH) protein/TolB-like protein